MSLLDDVRVSLREQVAQEEKRLVERRNNIYEMLQTLEKEVEEVEEALAYVQKLRSVDTAPEEVQAKPEPTPEPVAPPPSETKPSKPEPKKSAEAPKRKKRQPQSQDQRDRRARQAVRGPTAQKIIEFLKTQDRAVRREKVAAAIGSTVNNVSWTLNKLVDAGYPIQRSLHPNPVAGRRPITRWQYLHDTAPEDIAQATIGKHKNAPGQRVEKVKSVLAQAGQLSGREISKRVGITPAETSRVLWMMLRSEEYPLERIEVKDEKNNLKSVLWRWNRPSKGVVLNVGTTMMPKEAEKRDLEENLVRTTQGGMRE